MSIYTAKLSAGDVHVVRCDRFWTMPCLRLDDNNCSPGVICLEIDEQGVASCAYLGSLTFSQSGPIRGWGSLDSDDVVELQPEVAAWSVAVPRELLDKLAEWSGMRFSID